MTGSSHHKPGACGRDRTGAGIRTPGHRWNGSGVYYFSALRPFALALAYSVVHYQRKYAWALAYVFFNAILAVADSFYSWSLRPLWLAEAWILVTGLAGFCLFAMYRSLERRLPRLARFRGCSGRAG